MLDLEWFAIHEVNFKVVSIGAIQQITNGFLYV